MPYYVYILANKPNGTLYIGVTSNLENRVYQHKNALFDGFTKKYSKHLIIPPSNQQGFRVKAINLYQ